MNPNPKRLSPPREFFRIFSFPGIFPHSFSLSREFFRILSLFPGNFFSPFLSQKSSPTRQIFHRPVFPRALSPAICPFSLPVAGFSFSPATLSLKKQNFASPHPASPPSLSGHRMPLFFYPHPLIFLFPAAVFSFPAAIAFSRCLFDAKKPFPPYAPYHNARTREGFSFHQDFA